MIVGYSYNASQYCDDCMHGIAKTGAAEAGSAMSWGDCGNAEQVLNEWASMLGLDRDDETTFDSNEFPKVITLQMAEHDKGWGSDMRCERCGHDLTNTEWL